MRIETLKAAIVENILSNDLIDNGSVKDHMKAPEGSDEKVATGEVYYTAQVRLPKGTKIVLDGREFFSDQLTVRIDAFNLYDTPNAPKATDAKPQAATVNADKLGARFSKGGNMTVHNPAPQQ